MAVPVVQLTVGDYAKWRPAFESGREMRAQAGITGAQVYRDADDPAEILIWAECADPAKARAQMANPEVAKVMRGRGVMGPPPPAFT